MSVCTACIFIFVPWASLCFVLVKKKSKFNSMVLNDIHGLVLPKTSRSG